MGLKTKMLSSLLPLGFASVAEAKIIYYGSETETVTISFNTATLLRFDEEVKTISQASKFSIEPADPLEPNYRILSVKPRIREGSDTVTFILANETVVNLKINTVAQPIPEKTDHFYDLKPKDLKVDPLSDGVKGADISELELMKAMIRSDNLVGYEAKSMNRPVNSGAEGVKAELVRVYTGPRFNGYVFKVVNTSSDVQYAIDLKSLVMGRPNVALLSQVDERILPPAGDEKGKNTTFLRVVAKPSSVYYSVVLPVEPIVKK